MSLDNTARQQILARIRAAATAAPAPAANQAAHQAARQKAVQNFLKTAKDRVIDILPARRAGEDPLTQFKAHLGQLSASFGQVDDIDQLPAHFAQQLLAWGQDSRFHISSAVAEMGVPPHIIKHLKALKGGAAGDMDYGEGTIITSAKWGIAETGSVVVCSGKDKPILDHFLVKNLFVLLHKADLVSDMDQLWQAVRAHYGDAHYGGLLPRNLVIVSGPSRTGDIAQKIELGAHGPLHLHICLIP